MSSSPIIIESLKRLVEEGFNTGVVALIEHQVLCQAIIQRAIKGYTAHPRDDVLDLATQLLPRGESLYQLYTETLACMSRQKVDDLEQISSNLAVCAQSLESTAVKALASMVDSPLAARAQVEHTIGMRYAQLLEAAETLERSGVITVRHSGSLANLTSKPLGPLSAFYDKAQAIVANRQESAYAARPRMAA
jgi:hypothetical protein